MPILREAVNNRPHLFACFIRSERSLPLPEAIPSSSKYPRSTLVKVFVPFQVALSPFPPFCCSHRRNIRPISGVKVKHVLYSLYPPASTALGLPQPGTDHSAPPPDFHLILPVLLNIRWQKKAHRQCIVILIETVPPLSLKYIIELLLEAVSE